MDNIVVKKVWEDDFGIELNFYFITSNVKINSNIDIRREELLNNNSIFQIFKEQGTTDFTLLFGHIGDNYGPGIKLNIHLNKFGHLEIEATVEISDDVKPKHQCNFLLLSEIGVFDKFIGSLCWLADAPVETECNLVDIGKDYFTNF